MMTKQHVLYRTMLIRCSVVEGLMFSTLGTLKYSLALCVPLSDFFLFIFAMSHHGEYQLSVVNLAFSFE